MQQNRSSGCGVACIAMLARTNYEHARVTNLVTARVCGLKAEIQDYRNCAKIYKRCPCEIMQRRR